MICTLIHGTVLLTMCGLKEVCIVRAVSKRLVKPFEAAFEDKHVLMLGVILANCPVPAMAFMRVYLCRPWSALAGVHAVEHNRVVVLQPFDHCGWIVPNLSCRDRYSTLHHLLPCSLCGKVRISHIHYSVPSLVVVPHPRCQRFGGNVTVPRTFVATFHLVLHILLSGCGACPYPYPCACVRACACACASASVQVCKCKY